MRRVLLLALLTGLLPLANAQDPASVERAKACDERTQGVHLSNEQYRAYMRACLASEGSPRNPKETLRTLEKRCNTVANERQLTGQDRVSFMESCRRKG